MGFTNAYANTILKDLFASGRYIALATATPTASSSGSTIVEPSSSDGYTREDVDQGSFSAANRTITNEDYIYFPEATASWGTVTHLCVVSKKTGGDMYYFGAITDSSGNAGVSVGANTVPLFKPNTINISLDED